MLVAIGPMSTDVYLPSLPGIAADLRTSNALAQLTVGLFIGGFAVAILVCGPLADRFGRRPVLFGGMILFLLATIACALAVDIGQLLAARFVQAIGAGVGPVIGRAVVRDLYGPEDSGRILGYMTSAMALAPMIGPFIGGQLEVAFGWRSNFWFLAVYAIGLTGALWWRLPETRPVAPTRLSLAGLRQSYGLLLHDRRFVGFMLCVALGFGALFSWISNSAFVVIEHFGVAPDQFGWAFGAVVAGNVLGAFAGSRTGVRLGVTRATGLGCAICAVAGVVLLIAGWGEVGGLWLMVAGMALSFFGCGHVMPQGTAGALGPFPLLAGTAAALAGSVQMLTGLAVAALTSALFDGTPRPMVTANALCAALALLVFWQLLSRRTDP